MLTIKVYEPLASDKNGTFIQSLLDSDQMFENYRQTVSANLGYDEMSFEIVPTDDVQIDIWQRLGHFRHIEVYDDSLSLIWEGFVNQVESSFGGLLFVRGPATDLANKVRVAYSGFDPSTVPPTVGVRKFTDWASNADSQARYGIYELVYSLGGVQDAIAQQVRDAVLADMAYVVVDDNDAQAGGERRIKISCLGYGHMMKMWTYYNATQGSTTATTKIASVVAADPNGILSTVTSNLSTNSTSIAINDLTYRTAAEIITGIVSLGDSSNNRWVFGLGAGRIPYYRQVVDTPTYYRSAINNGEVFLYGSNMEVRPYDIQPGYWMQYQDILFGVPAETRYRNDPGKLFIETVEYTAPNGLSIRGAKNSRLAQKLRRMGLGGGA